MRRGTRAGAAAVSQASQRVTAGCLRFADGDRSGTRRLRATVRRGATSPVDSFGLRPAGGKRPRALQGAVVRAAPAGRGPRLGGREAK